MKNFTQSIVFLILMFTGFSGLSQDLGPNIALGQPTSQSSLGWEGDSEKAVDGNTSGAFDNNNLSTNSVTHTATPYQGGTEWWRVDLGDIYDLSVIRIYNREGSEAVRLRGAEVHVGTTDSHDLTDFTKVGDLTQARMQVLGNNLGSARYVLISQTGILSLAEVQVFAFPQNCPPAGMICDDGNPNTINDMTDGNCGCTGTVVTCEDLVLQYQLNNDPKKDALLEITVNEGDDVALSLNIDGIFYTVANPNNDVIDPFIGNILSSQAGLYTIVPNLDRMVIFTNSEEIAMEDGSASRALDGDNNTYWHTDWSIDDDNMPHEIVIDLREPSTVSGLEYLPRQDNVLHGTISEYEIYVSNSTTEWGTPVANGHQGGTGANAPWAYDRALKVANFNAKQGRYVRLVAISEGGGNNWASAAEINVISQPITPCVKTLQINVGTAYTFNGTSWSPSDPNTTSLDIYDSLQIDSGEAVISNNMTCYSLTVAPGAGVIINNGVTFTANITTLQSTSQMFSSLILNGAINGTVNYKRFVNIIGTSAGGGNDLISAPLANQEFGSFASLNDGDLAASGSLRAFAPYNTAVGAYQNYDINTNVSTVMASGIGHRVASVNGSTLTFEGDAVKTDVSVSISNAAAGHAWNLIGNPYPSYIHFTTFLNTNMNELESAEAYQAIYGYNGQASDKWEVWNLATSNPTDLIAPGQGFFVKAKSSGSGGIIQFTPEMRRSGTADDFILGRGVNNFKALSKLKITKDSQSASTSIYFIKGTTRGLDPGYDAATYSATSVDFSLFTNLLEGNSELDIAIQSLPYNDYNNVSVPLGIKAKKGKELTISIDELSTLPNNIYVYLEDNENNNLTLLNNDSYTFKTLTDLNGTGRFQVHYSAKLLSLNDVQSEQLQIFIENMTKVLVVKGQLPGPSTARLYDLHGRLVSHQTLNPNNLKNTIDISTISTGVYVIKIHSDHQVVTQKLIVR